MATHAVIKTGGKQYIVKEGSEIIVDRLEGKEKDTIGLDTLATFIEKGDITLGEPLLKEKTQATIEKHIKGDKIRVARFKAKVRYRKVKGFRSYLTILKIGKIL